MSNETQNQHAVRTAVLEGAEVRMYNDYHLHLTDVKTCAAVMMDHHSVLIGSSSDLKKILWAGVFAKFFLCFQSSASRRLITADKVFSNNPNGKAVFKELEHTRNKHLIHDENNMRQCNVVVQVSLDDGSRKMMTIAPEMTFNQQDYDHMAMLINQTLDYLHSQINMIGQRLEAKLASMSLDEINRLKEWQFDANAAMFRKGNKRTRLD